MAPMPMPMPATDAAGLMALVRALDVPREALADLPEEKLRASLEWLARWRGAGAGAGGHDEERTEEEDTRSALARQQLARVFCGWTAPLPPRAGHGYSMLTRKQLPLGHWLLLLRMGVLLAQAAPGHGRDGMEQWLLTSALQPVWPPRGDRGAQRELAVALADAALLDADDDADDDKDVLATRHLALFAAAMARAMDGAAFEFLHHVGNTLVAHLRARFRDSSLSAARMAVAAGKFVAPALAPQWDGAHCHQQAAAVLVVVAVAVAAATPATATPSASRIQSLRRDLINAAARGLARGRVFPDEQSPFALLAVALLPPLDQCERDGEGHAVEDPALTLAQAQLQQFLLFRAVALALHAPPGSGFSAEELAHRRARHHSSLRAALALAPTPTQRAAKARMLGVTEALVREARAVLRQSRAWMHALVDAMQTADAALLGPSLRVFQAESVALTSQPTNVETKTKTKTKAPAQCLTLLAALDGAVATTLALLLPADGTDQGELLRGARVLLQLAFVRECGGSGDGGGAATTSGSEALLREVLPRVEELVVLAPDTTLQSLCQLVLTDDAAMGVAVDMEVDVVWGWTALAVGQLVQRQLRVLLGSATTPATRQAALALVLRTLFHGLAPLDAFADRFTSFALTQLSSLLSVDELVPMYLRAVLTRFPSTAASTPRLSSALGVVFGALYYTPASGGAGEHSPLERRAALILWALRQCRQRAVALLVSANTNTDANTNANSCATPSHSDTNASINNTNATTDANANATTSADGLVLAQLFLEVAKMAPLALLPRVAVEMEALVADVAARETSPQIVGEVLRTVAHAVAHGCEADQRAWLAAWFLQLVPHYANTRTRTSTSTSGNTNANGGAAMSRL